LLHPLRVGRRTIGRAAAQSDLGEYSFDAIGNTALSVGTTRPTGEAGEGLTASDVLRLPWRRQGVMLTVRWSDGVTVREFFARTSDAYALRAFRPTGGGASTRFHSTR